MKVPRSAQTVRAFFDERGPMALRIMCAGNDGTCRSHLASVYQSPYGPLFVTYRRVSEGGLKSGAAWKLRFTSGKGDDPKRAEICLLPPDGPVPTLSCRRHRAEAVRDGLPIDVADVIAAYEAARKRRETADYFFEPAGAGITQG